VRTMNAPSMATPTLQGNSTPNTLLKRVVKFAWETVAASKTS
jgi:hypothetical protein